MNPRRSRPAAWILSLCVLTVASGTVRAGGIAPLDDSLSVVHGAPLAVQWDADKPGLQHSRMARVSARASMVFDTQAYAGRRVRVHQTMMPTDAPWLARWQSQGRFVDGQSRPGQRVLFYEGQLPIGTRRLEGEVVYEFSVDGSFVNDFQNVVFTYDIEVLQ